MDINQLKSLFEQFISSYWSDISSFCPMLGAFILNHTDKTVYMDENATRLLALPEGNTYKNVIDRIDEIENRFIKDLSIKKIVDSPLITMCVIKSITIDSTQSINNEALIKFNKLLSENLFQYHFQPIVNAHSGDIIAYEALMRTDNSIGMSPYEILTIAEKTDNLYAIEKLTLFNTLKYVSDNRNMFDNKKLFINSITACVLSDEDWSKLELLYGDIMSRVVIELTEQTEISNDNLEFIKTRLSNNNLQLAIDDYGTGYSNTTSVLRYKPNFVKIDRSLISEIDTKPNIQKLVGGIIEFTHNNGIITLAEGVETLDEMATVIRLGVDLLQGFYVSKPKPFLMEALASSAQKDINIINLEYSSEIAKTYHTVDNDIVDLHKLSSERYNVVYIESKNVTFIGDSNEYHNILFITGDEIETNVTFSNVNIKSDKDDPFISIGNHSTLHLNVIGENRLLGRGINTPATATLDLKGPGSLYILAERPMCYGIGVSKNHSHGTININLIGELTIEANGDDVVCIGGGKNTHGNKITISSGSIRIISSGNRCLGVGTMSGGSSLDIHNSSIEIFMAATNCVGIGSFGGSASVNLANLSLNIGLSGLILCGVGVGKSGSGAVYVRDADIKVNAKGREISGIGANSGNVKVNIIQTSIKIVCEGNSATGIGDNNGSGDIYICRSSYDISILAEICLGVGSSSGKCLIDACNETITMNPE